MTFTKERLEQFINNPLEHGLTRGEQMELARQLLAGIEQEPVAWRWFHLNQWHVTSDEEQARDLAWDGVKVMPLYAAPPAPVVDADDNFYSWFGREWHEHYQQNQYTTAAKQMLGVMAESAWKAGRRAAMLQGAEPVSNRDELREQVRREHAEWSQATFGDVGPVGPLKHLSKEALEAAANPEDPLEWADMQFLLWDAQRRMGLSDNFITRAMIEKLAINKQRQWPEQKDGEPRLHIKEQSESVFPEVECDICGHVSTDPEGRHYCCEDNSND